MQPPPQNRSGRPRKKIDEVSLRPTPPEETEGRKPGKREKNQLGSPPLPPPSPFSPFSSRLSPLLLPSKHFFDVAQEEQGRRGGGIEYRRCKRSIRDVVASLFGATRKIPLQTAFPGKKITFFPGGTENFAFPSSFLGKGDGYQRINPNSEGRARWEEERKLNSRGQPKFSLCRQG